MSNPIRLVIIEDQEFMANALHSWLGRQSDCVVLGCACDGEAGWELCKSTRPDLALADIQMPRMNGFEFAEKLFSELPGTRLLFMSGLVDPHTVFQVTQSKANGYVSKTHSTELLMTAIRTVARGESYFCPAFEQVKRELLSQPNAFQKLLTDREQEILMCLASGRDDRSIGAHLNISAATVSVHRKNIRKKLDLHSDRDLLAYAQQWGFRF